MGTPFRLSIVLPESAIPPREILGLDVPAADGRLTVLANHQSLIAALVPGAVYITTLSGHREVWQISAGALEVAAGVATLLVRSARLLHRDG